MNRVSLLPRQSCWLALVLMLVVVSAGCAEMPPLLRIPSQQTPPAGTGPSWPATSADLPAGDPSSGQPTRQPEQLQPVSGAASIGDPKAPELGNTGYDVQAYALDLRLDPKAELLEGTSHIGAVSTLDGLSRLSLDFMGYDISQVDVAGQPASFERGEDKLWIDLPTPLAAGQAFTVSVSYGGQPETIRSRFVPFSFLGLHLLSESNRAFALNEPDGARTWFPGNDHPMDKALFEFRIEVPKPLVAVANGQLIDQEDLGEFYRYTYAVDEPMATYLATIAVADYEVIEDVAPNGVPLRHYVFPESRQDAEAIFAVTGEAMAWLEELFGPYPFDSYGHVVANAGGLALETQTMTLWGDGFLGETPEAVSPVVVHELAHQWFGDSVSPASWAESWLNEGFATYAMLLWAAREDPDQGLGALATYERNAETAGRSPLNDPAPEQLFGGDAYFKGAWVLHMLRQEIGDELFFATVRSYASRFAGQTATTDDLQVVAEAVSGQDLSTFFDQWVRRPEIPVIQLGWALEEWDGRPAAMLLRVCQAQPGASAQPFQVPLTVAWQAGAETQKVTLPVADREQGYVVPSLGPVTSVVADPDNDLLAIVETTEIDALTPCPSATD